MDTLKIGQIINSPQNRDAVHMAIVPVEAGQLLVVGTHVGLLDGLAVSPYGSTGAKRRSLKPIGIVDPFLTDNVPKGDKFWLFLYPGSITSLRHAWTHPEFSDDAELKQQFSARQLSQQWLEDFCEREGEGMSYEGIVEGYSGSVDGFEPSDEFKRHYLIATGEECPEYFSCSC